MGDNQSKHSEFKQQQAEAKARTERGWTAEQAGYWPAGPGFQDCGCPTGEACN